MEIRNDLVMCAKNHYFNASLSNVCPICGSPAAGGRPGGYPPAAPPRVAAPPVPNAPPRVAAPPNAWNAPGGGVNPYGAPAAAGAAPPAPVRADPVVGWVVCIEGPKRGTSWNLHAGYNHIGGEGSDINIQSDGQISREKHATVAYYDKNRTYYVGPAEGRNIIELNDQPVFGSTQLKSRDIIKIGDTRLMFVPLCGEDFTWD